MIGKIIKRGAVMRLVVFVIVVFGGYTYGWLLPREAAPEVDIPVVMVTTPYIGVAPRDIETLVTTPIENEISSLKGINQLASSSVEGASIISIEFDPEVVIEDALQQVRERVNRAKPKLPADAEEPAVSEISFSDFPVVILTLAGPLSEQGLKKLGEEIADDAKKIQGVLGTVVTGGREREIKVQVDPFRLANMGLALNDVINALSGENVNIPGGDITTGDSTFLLRVPGDFVQASDLETVAVKRVGDRPVLLRDIARIVDGLDDRASYARMNGQTAVSVGVTKRTGVNLLEVVDKFKTQVALRAEGPDWPAGVTYRFLGDQSQWINDMVSELENGVLTALILVVMVLFVAMGVRNSLFVAFAIPISMLLSMLVLSLLGFTLNMIVLFSLILVLGMLVDNAIVVVENIYRHVELGKPIFEAAVVGTREVGLAVAASTATTVVAFLPLVFWKGVMGQFMGYMPKTVIVVLLASLFVAIFVLPVATDAWMKLGRRRVKTRATTGAAEPGWARAYKRLLNLSISHRYVSASIGAATLIVTFVAYGTLNHGVSFFPDVEPNRATIAVRAPDGTDLEATDKIVRQVEALLLAEENVDVYVAETGVSGSTDPIMGAQAVKHLARITVDFRPDRNTVKSGEAARVEPTTKTIDRLRERMALITGAEIKIDKERMGPPVGADVEVEVSGDDFHAVGVYAAKLRKELAVLEGVADLTDNYRVGRPEMRLRIDRARAKRVGASTRDAASAVRTAVAGNVATTLRDGEDEYDIVVQVMPEYRDDLQSVLALRIPGRLDTSPDTFQVPLSAVASYELAGGSGTIRHIDQDLMVTVSGNAAEGVNPNAVRGRVQAYLDDVVPPAGIDLRLGGAQDEQQETAAFLMRAFAIAVVLILLVLVTQFNRFDIPVIIIASVVLSLIGVLWGLIITGTPFGIMMTGLGVISLAGVVVNNAIVLLDYVEQLRAKGMSSKEALVEAGITRFRPVILTAITTVLGLIPMAIGLSFDFRNIKWIVASQSATWWGPMAIAVIFGLLVATLLTLVMVPTFYSIFEDLRVRIEKRRKVRGEPAAAATS